MTSWGLFFLNAFLFFFFVWMVSSAFVILNRAFYDIRYRHIRDAKKQLADHGSIEVIFSRLPRSVIERIAADSTTDSKDAEAFSSYIIARWGAERLVKAAARTGRRHRWSRIAALRILVLGGYPHVIPLLRAAIDDGNRDLVAAAVVLLGRICNEAAAQVLIELLARGTYRNSRIATQIEQFPLPIGHLLRPLLEHPKPSVKFWAATLFVRYGSDVEAGVKLASLVDDADPRVRKAAIETLGKTDHAPAAECALHLLHDPVWFVRAHAARALGDLRRVDLGASVAKLMGDTEWWVRFAAKEALQAMGEDAVPVLIESLASPDTFARNGAAEVLQNLGVLDALLTESVDRADDSDRLSLIKRILSAGDQQLIRAAVDRVEAKTGPAVLRILAAAGIENV